MVLATLEPQGDAVLEIDTSAGKAALPLAEIGFDAPANISTARSRPVPAQRGPERRQPAPHDGAAGRAVPLHHAVELPARDGHAQGRPGDRRRLHVVVKPAQADAAVHARDGQILEEAGLPARRAQRHHGAPVGRG